MASDLRADSTERFLWSVLAGVCFAASAALFVVPFFGVERIWPAPLSSGDGSMAVAALLAAFLVGAACWRCVESRVERRYVVGGVVAGVATGTVAHPVAWFLWGVLSGSLWMGVLFLVPLFWLFGLLFFGIVTVPLAVAAGVTVGLLRVGAIRHREELAEGRTAE